jgi:hypothetical protein
MLPWALDADYISTADVAVLAALVSLASDSGTVDPGLIRMGWSARPAVLTTLLPGSTKRLPELVTLHECVFGAGHGGARHAESEAAGARAVCLAPDGTLGRVGNWATSAIIFRNTAGSSSSIR